jgi:hypothetical protein
MSGKATDVSEPYGQTALISSLIWGFTHPDLQVFSGQPRFDLGRGRIDIPPASIFYYSMFDVKLVSEVRRAACLPTNASVMRWHSHWNLLLNEQLLLINGISLLR